MNVPAFARRRKVNGASHNSEQTSDHRVHGQRHGHQRSLFSFTRQCQQTVVGEDGRTRYLATHRQLGESRNQFICVDFVQRTNTVVQVWPAGHQLPLTVHAVICRHYSRSFYLLYILTLKLRPITNFKTWALKVQMSSYLGLYICIHQKIAKSTSLEVTDLQLSIRSNDDLCIKRADVHLRRYNCFHLVKLSNDYNYDWLVSLKLQMRRLLRETHLHNENMNELVCRMHNLYRKTREALVYKGPYCAVWK